jgi:hypothetical protein
MLADQSFQSILIEWALLAWKINFRVYGILSILPKYEKYLVINLSLESKILRFLARICQTIVWVIAKLNFSK